MEQTGFPTAIRHVLQAEQRMLPDFRIEYAVVSGPRHGTASEYEQRLQVDGTGEARLFRRRSPAETDMLPPGSYRGLVPREEILDFIVKLEKAPLDAIPSQVPSPTDPGFHLSVVAARKLFTFRWSRPSRPVAPELDAVLSVLNRWVRGACPTPIWSLALKPLTVRFTGEGIEATLLLENSGPETLYVVHPASPGPADLIGLSLRHGIQPPRTPGVTPLPMEVEEESLAVQPLPEPELVPVGKDKPLEFTVRAPIAFQAGGGRVGIFSYRCYLHPAGAAGLPVFAGAVFSGETRL